MEWLDSNLLTLNVSRTRFITFTANAATQPTTINLKSHSCSMMSSDTPFIQRVSDIKYVGVQIDSTPNWDKHIELTTTRFCKLMFPMKKLRTVVDAMLLKIYISCTSTASHYLLHSGLRRNLQNLNATTRKSSTCCFKTMLNKSFRYPTTQLYKETTILTVKQLMSCVNTRHTFTFAHGLLNVATLIFVLCTKLKLPWQVDTIKPSAVAFSIN